MPLVVERRRRRTAGTLIRPRACYICKQRYTQVDAFYHQLCPTARPMSHAKREARTDLTGTRALLTGGRAKIGMYIALRLLRDGAHTTITTRFPHDAVRRFAAMPDSAEWLHRLRIVGIDLRDPAQVDRRWPTRSASAGPLDILINNAAQTVRRSPGAYAAARRRRAGAAARRAAAGARDLRAHERRAPGRAGRRGRWRPRPERSRPPSSPPPTLTALALTAGSASLDAASPPAPRSTPAACCPTSRRVNSWTQRVDEVDAARAARGAAVQHDGAVHPGQPAAPGAGRVAGTAHVRRQRLGDGGQFSPRLQGSRAPAHQHGQGRAEHADPHERARDVRDRRHPDDQRRHRLDHRRAPAPDQGAARRRGLPRPARPGRRRGAGLRPDRARRGRRGPVRRASSRTTPPSPW